MKHHRNLYMKAFFISFTIILISLPGILNACVKAKDFSKVTVAGGSLTEVIYLLGLEKNLVAVDITSNFPEEATTLPSIGYVRALSAEGVLSLSPTLILGENDMGPTAVIEQLNRVGIEIQIIPEENSVDGVLKKVECIADIFGVSESSKDLSLKNLKNEAEDLKNIAQINMLSTKKVMFILGMESGSPTVGGSGTSADGLIKMIGAKNVMDSFEGWKPVSTEAIIEASPDLILISNRGLSSFKTTEKLGAHPSLVFTPASKNNNIIAMDGMAMLGFGPRTIFSAREIALYIKELENE